MGCQEVCSPPSDQMHFAAQHHLEQLSSSASNLPGSSRILRIVSRLTLALLPLFIDMSLVLPDELLLTSLNTQYPCRELQIRQLAYLLCVRSHQSSCKGFEYAKARSLAYRTHPFLSLMASKLRAKAASSSPSSRHWVPHTR